MQFLHHNPISNEDSDKSSIEELFVFQKEVIGSRSASTNRVAFQLKLRSLGLKKNHLMTGQTDGNASIAYIENNIINAKAGSMFLFCAGVRHHISVRSEPSVVLDGIHFDFFDELDIINDEEVIVQAAEYNKERLCFEPLIEGFALLSYTPLLFPSPKTIACMERVIDEFDRRQPGYELICRGLMQQILTHLYRLRFEMNRLLPQYVEARMTELERYIESKFMDDCSNAALARMLNVHEDYMAKQFKAAFGMSPNKYVKKIRKREAKRLLRETTETVEIIGVRVGYKDIHYFSRIFHKWECMSPLEYRKLSRFY